MAKGGHIARQVARRLDKPRLHMVRKTWPGYIALYRDGKGREVVVKSITEPEETRKFKVQGGIRKFRRVRYKQHLQEVLVVARSTKAPAKKKAGSSRRKKQEDVEVTDDEIDELESVDELEEDEDEELEEDEDEEEEEDEEPEDEEDDDELEDEDEEDEDEDEEPPKRSKKPRKSRAAENGMIGTSEIAARAEVDSRTLRMVLRKHKVEKDPETRRYQWKSWNDKTVKKILRWLEEGEAEGIKKEALDALKERQEGKRAAKKNGAGKKAGKKKAAAKKRRRVVEEDEDDE